MAKYPPKLEELKEDMLTRVTSGRHPFEGGLKVEDVRRACDLLKNLDDDHWVQVWSEIAKPYEEKGQQHEQSGNAAEAERNYLMAYGYLKLARWPTHHTPAKLMAYRSAVDNYLKAAQYFDPPLEKLVIPFAGKEGEGKEIIAYLRKPKGIERPPVVIKSGGTDHWKEDRPQFEPLYLERGMAHLGVDMPGSGEAPLKTSDDAERYYTTIIDYIQGRPDLDASRIGLVGISAGGYWALKMAYVENERLTAAVCWGGSAGHHQSLVSSKDFRDAMHAHNLGNTHEWIGPAGLFGFTTFEELEQYRPRYSIVNQGLLDQPSCPMLLVDGKEAKLPIKDYYLLLEHGSPKTVRIFPGGHMGFSPQTLPTIRDWLAGYLCPGGSPLGKVESKDFDIPANPGH
ncbi:alpha/beta hydrolase [Chloroflexota bacterium]